VLNHRSWRANAQYGVKAHSPPDATTPRKDEPIEFRIQEHDTLCARVRGALSNLEKPGSLFGSEALISRGVAKLQESSDWLQAKAGQIF